MNLARISAETTESWWPIRKEVRSMLRLADLGKLEAKVTASEW